MMKKLLISFAAIAALVSCVKEAPATDQNTNIDETPVVEETIVTLTALGPEVTDPNATQQQNAPASRTQLVDGSKVMWSPGDVVKLCFLPKAYSDHTNSTKYGYNTNFTYGGTELSEAASFQGTWGPAKANLLNTDGFVVYPGNSDNFTFSAQTDDYAAVSFTIAYNLPTEQEAVEGSFDNGLNLSYSLISSNDVANNTAKVTFKNLCAIFRINLPSTEYNIKSIKLESEDKSNNYYLTGRKEFNLETNALTGKDKQSASKPSYVLLRKADGSNLKAGASYYAVVWGQDHYCRGVKITFTNDKGKECVKVAGSGNWISTDPGKCITFNISSLSFTSTPYLNVDATSITASAKGDTESFAVTANNAVTVTSDQAWLTASYADGQCTIVYQKNRTSSSRTATVTITSAGLTKKVSVSQAAVTYRISGSALTKASDLADGQMYVVRRQASSAEYWSVNSSGTLVLATVSNTSSFTGNQVFIFNKDNSQAAGVSYGSGYNDKYSYMSAGAWQSVWTDQYLNHSFYLGSNKYYFSMYSGWKQYSYSQKTGEDFDIYKANDSNMFNWTGSYFNWGNSGTDKYKWTFYKAVEN